MIDLLPGWIAGKGPPGNSIRSLYTLLLATLLFFLTVASFFPGGMAPDTLVQLAQTCTGKYADAHPPIMAALWRFLFDVWNNAGVLFVFHNFFYWFLWSVFSWMAFKGWKARMLTLGLAALPPLWTQAVGVLKDTELSICILGAYLFALLARISEQDQIHRKGLFANLFRTVAWLFFFYSSAVRLNSLPLLIPLSWYLLAKDRERIFSWRMGLMILAVISTSFWAVQIFDYRFLKSEKDHHFQACEIFDIVGIFTRTGDEDVIPKYWKEMNQDVSPRTLLLNYQPQSLNSLIYTGLVRMTGDSNRLDELNRQWFVAIRRHPRAYLEHRWDAFRELLRLGEEKSYLPFQLEVYENRLGLKYEGDSRLKAFLEVYFSAFQNTPIFKGWPYMLALLLVLIAHGLVKFPATPFKLASLCSALSAFFYGAGYFFYSLSSDFRFWYPVVTLSVFSIVLYWKGHKKAGEPLTLQTLSSTSPKT